MIYLIHGANTQASYQRLNTLTSQVPSEKRLKLTKENTLEDLYAALFGQSILEERTFIVCENYLGAKIIKSTDKILTQVPKEKTLIFWEPDQLTPAVASKFPKDTIVEAFKTEPKSFWFLDSLTPGSKLSLSKLNGLGIEDKKRGLLPTIASRVLLLTLAKLNLDAKTASTVAGYNLQDWQWQKIQNQARPFTLENLKAFFQGILKADMMIKTGQTSLSEEDLASFLLVKYIKV